MKIKLEIAFSAAVLFAIPSIAQAQRGPQPMSSGRMRSVAAVHAFHAPAIRMRTLPSAARMRPLPANVRANPSDISTGIVFAGGTPIPIENLSNSMPGLGLDPHQFGAINDDLGVKAFIDPATQLRLATTERFLRDFQFAGAFIPIYGGYGDNYDNTPPVAENQPANPQQPQVIVIQVPAAQQAVAPAQQAEAETPAQPPLPDVGQFILVLRNGKQIQAVAFTQADNQIVYITADGLRRTIATGDLDTSSTERINQERGTPIQLSL